MKYLVRLLFFLFLLLFNHALAERCEGSPWCTICTDCSRCGYCTLEGNSCGVCRSPRSPQAPQKSTDPRKEQSSVEADIDGDGVDEKLISTFWGGLFVDLTVVDEAGEVIAGDLSERVPELQIPSMVSSSQIVDVDGDGSDELVQQFPGRGGPNPWLCVFSWDGNSMKESLVCFLYDGKSPILEKISHEIGVPLTAETEIPFVGFKYHLASIKAGKGEELLLSIRPQNGYYSFSWSREALARARNGRIEIKAWQTPWTYRNFSQGFILPEVHFAEINESDLKRLSAKELTLLRNEVYAIHGRPFSDPELRAYFNSKPWYEVSRTYKDDEVPKQARKNAALIGNYQRKKGLLW